MGKMFKDCKAEKLLSLWWFFVLGVIGGGLVIGVLIHTSTQINVDELEADILSERITRCISDNGFLDKKVLDNSFDIFEDCNLNKIMFEEGSNFYFNISIYNPDDSLNKEIVQGVSSFEADCSIQKKVNAKHFPKCVEKQETFLFKQGDFIEEFKLEILTASNQEGKKIHITV